MNHIAIDEVSLALARSVAERLCSRPELIAVARENLARWSRQNAASPSLLRCYAEWEALLARSVGEVCDLLVAQTDEAQRLRQNSPFAGVLSPVEVWEIKALHRHATTPA